MALATYYFDGHSSITDPGSNWTNDANAFDGSTSTFATASAGSTTSSLYLYGIGTTAPSSGITITSVVARLYGTSLTLGKKAGAEIYTTGLAEQLSPNGTLVSGGNSTTGYGPNITLTAPAAGWSWATLQALEIKMYDNAAGNDVYRVEFDVSTSHNAWENAGQFFGVGNGMSRSEVAN